MLKVSGGLKWCEAFGFRVVDTTIQTLRASVSVKRVRRSVEKSSRAHQVPRSMSWTPYNAGAVRGAFRLLDGVVLAHHFARRPSAMKSVPRFL